VPVEDDAIPPPRPVVRPVKPVDDESLADRGRELFFKLQCGACHTEAAGARGPALTGLFGTRVNLKGGGAVVADDAYIAESIRRPRAKVVEGWSPVMPLYDTDRVSDDEVRAIVAFVKARKRGDPVPKGEHFPPPVGSPVERSEPAPRPREK
jgi:cytochrome c oxidase subunit 2